jgi:hypothetical protein
MRYLLVLILSFISACAERIFLQYEQCNIQCNKRITNVVIFTLRGHRLQFHSLLAKNWENSKADLRQIYVQGSSDRNVCVCEGGVTPPSQ